MWEMLAPKGDRNAYMKTWDSFRTTAFQPKKSLSRHLAYSPQVHQQRCRSVDMGLNAADFEDPFAFDATKLSKDDLQLRLSVSFFFFVHVTFPDIRNFPFAHANLDTAVLYSLPTVMRLECVDHSPSNRP